MRKRLGEKIVAAGIICAALVALLRFRGQKQNRGRVVPVRTIYETVWHETYMPASNNTVMVHIVNLRKKLEEDPANPRLIRTVWGKGYQID